MQSFFFVFFGDREERTVFDFLSSYSYHPSLVSFSCSIIMTTWSEVGSCSEVDTRHESERRKGKEREKKDTTTSIQQFLFFFLWHLCFMHWFSGETFYRRNSFHVCFCFNFVLLFSLFFQFLLDCKKKAKISILDQTHFIRCRLLVSKKQQSLFTLCFPLLPLFPDFIWSIWLPLQFPYSLPSFHLRKLKRTLVFCSSCDCSLPLFVMNFHQMLTLSLWIERRELVHHLSSLSSFQLKFSQHRYFIDDYIDSWSWSWTLHVRYHSFFLVLFPSVFSAVIHDSIYYYCWE